MLFRTPVRRFYKNDRTKRIINPVRRWVYHWIFLGVLAAGSLYTIVQYQLAKYEAKHYGQEKGDRLCSPTTSDVLSLLPLNAISSLFGQCAGSEGIPSSLHHKVIQFLIWWYQINMDDAETTEFSTLQEFYSRPWKKEARPVDAEAVVVAPCDGVVTGLQEDVKRNTLVQVKGLTYAAQSLLQVDPGEVPAGYRRVLATVYLRVQDFHHVVSPIPFRCEGVAYVPGMLLSTSPAGLHWVGGVLQMNERLVVHGRGNSNDRHRKGSGQNRKEEPFCAVALVGSTLTGKMKIAFDRVIRTNFSDPPDYTVFRKYTDLPPFRPGDPVGSFLWGSTVAVVIDVPEKAVFVTKVNDVVKAGQALMVIP